MADQGSGEKKTSWFKAFIGTVAGLCSGAAAMYVTPFVDKAIKPAKPLANFKAEKDGLNVRFQNLSNVRQGYWDFGDGSPLEPVSADDFITHVFPGPGEYTVKLSLQNVINEENDRSVVVKLDGAAATAAAPVPHIAKFSARQVTPNAYAPITYEISSEVQNAQLCVWEMGDGRPIQVVQDGAASAGTRTVTFTRPGRHTVKLAVVNGTQHDEKQIDVAVAPPPPGVAMAMLTVSDTGTMNETSTKQVVMSVPFPREQKNNVLTFKDRMAAASSPGFTIADLRFSANGKELSLAGKTELDLSPLGIKNVHALRATLSPDRQKIYLTGELVRANLADPPNLVLPAIVMEQRAMQAAPTTCSATEALGLPGSGVPSAKVLQFPPLPSKLSSPHRELARVELRDGDAVLWHSEQLPATGTAVVQGRRVVITATRVNEQQVQINLVDAKNLRSGTE